MTESWANCNMGDNELNSEGYELFRKDSDIKMQTRFLEFIQDSFFTQHVLLPTRGDNILDLVMSDNEWLVENLTVGDTFGITDHCVIK